jgi:hypothetical protein
MNYCQKCSAPWDRPGKPGMRETCPKCGADLHSCLNCRHYDTSKSNQCYANVEDPVIYKDRANFCEEFSFLERKTPPSAPGPSKDDKAKEAFNNLFKKK